MAGIAEFVYTTVLKPTPLKKAANAAIMALLPRTVRVGPAVIHINPNDPVLSGALALRVYEREEIAFFRSVCRPGLTLLDIGANVGLYTGLAMHLCPHGRVFAFEPHAESCEFLHRTVVANTDEMNATATVFDCAASDRNDEAMLFLNPDNKADNRLCDAGGAFVRQPTQLCMVDTMLADCPSIDIIKIDVQGGEYGAIAGAGDLIRRSPRITLLSEFWPDGLAKSGHQASEYLDLLRGLGFKLFELDRGSLVSPDRPQRLAGRRYVNLVGIKGGRPRDLRQSATLIHIP